MRISDIILYNDHQVVVCHKPAGLPTQNDKTGDTSLHTMVQAYCKQDVYLVHRLDRPVSGVVIFAKTSQTATDLGLQFAEGRARKTYFALVAGGGEKTSGTFRHDLVREHGRTRLAKDGEDGKQCTMDFSLIRKLDNYNLLEIHPLTGRTHQIRAQLALEGMPIKGDVRYGARRGNRDRSIHLHCASIEIIHPTRKTMIRFDALPPEDPLWKAAFEDDLPVDA